MEKRSYLSCLLTLFLLMFTQSIKALQSFTRRFIEWTKWTLASYASYASFKKFYGKMRVGFCRKQENASF